VLGNLGHLALQAGDLVDARLLYEESLALRRMLDDRHGEAGSLANLADLARVAGDLTTARSLLDEALRTARELGDRYRIASLLVRRARLADELGDHAGAARLALDGLAEAGDAPSQTTLVEILEELGSAMAGMQRWELAVSLWSRAAATREAIGAPRLPRDRDRIDGLTGEARASLGDARFGDAEAKGLAANLTELIALSGEGY
jgi:tetratricopeptide (TPR) repeat protein